MTKSGDGTIKRMMITSADCKAIFSVQTDRNTPLEKSFTEIITFRIVSTARMIQGSGKGYCFSREKVNRFLIRIKCPIGAPAQRPTVKGDITQEKAILTKVA